MIGRGGAAPNRAGTDSTVDGRTDGSSTSTGTSTASVDHVNDDDGHGPAGERL